MTNDTPTPELSRIESLIVDAVIDCAAVDASLDVMGRVTEKSRIVRRVAEAVIALAPPRPSPAAGEGLRPDISAWINGVRERADLVLEQIGERGDSSVIDSPEAVERNYAYRRGFQAGMVSATSDVHALLSASPTPPGGIDGSPNEQEGQPETSGYAQVLPEMRPAQATGHWPWEKPEDHAPTADAARVDAPDGGTEAGRAGVARVIDPVAFGEAYIGNRAFLDGDGIYARRAERVEKALAKADKILALIAALRAPTRPVADAGEGWRDIASAPRDGTAILVYFGPAVGVHQVVWFDDIWSVDDNKFDPRALRGYCDGDDISWQPLPAPPHVAQTPGDKSRAQSKPSDPASQDLEGGKGR